MTVDMIKTITEKLEKTKDALHVLKQISPNVGHEAIYAQVEKMLDIIRVERPSFDWKTVKQGMAFKTQEDDIFIFECWYSQDPTKCFVIKHDLNLEAAIFNPHNLTRAPEHDLPEEK